MAEAVSAEALLVQISKLQQRLSHLEQTMFPEFESVSGSRPPAARLRDDTSHANDYREMETIVEVALADSEQSDGSNGVAAFYPVPKKVFFKLLRRLGYEDPSTGSPESILEIVGWLEERGHGLDRTDRRPYDAALNTALGMCSFEQAEEIFQNRVDSTLREH